ncbi:VanZ family protein [Streptomyces sp. MUM 178J]|uniref:VanZ family protein n=1 Tax=Streptomyces sp. MUM 178J TaxID=2791991 RepID=UPI001F033648|nr:VanZ family protein [Streptomyces sp. MUM 178J]WRQ78915.1 VanZ family protein [Streptomyces sp. MUM 178J]
MIEASIGAVPGLLAAFAVLWAMSAAVVALVSRRRERPVLLPVLAAGAVCGIVTVTLMPGMAGTAGESVCDAGWSMAQAAGSSSAWLNVALFIPAPLLLTMLFKRPLTVAGCSVAACGMIEMAQATVVAGRSCSVTDSVMNTAGALIGTAAGWALVRTWRRPVWKDLATSAAVLGVSAVVLTMWIRSADLGSYDEPAQQAHQRAVEAQADSADAWITEAARETFGPNAEYEGSEYNKAEGLITATTSLGEITGRWPDETLISAAVNDNEAEPGDLTHGQAVQVGKRFAERWFPKQIQGAKLTTDVLAADAGNRAMHHLTYRRYVDGVMMPMRLDLTVTSAGRLLGFTADPVADPEMPRPKITKAGLGDVVRKQTGSAPVASVLLAQKVSGQWRPVWMVGVQGVDESDVFIDAVTGDLVAPDA